MKRESRRRLESLRRAYGPVENQVMDDLFACEMSREEFLRRGTMFGLTVSALSAALVAAGEAPVAFARTAGTQAGGRLRVGVIPPPTGPIEPHQFSDGGRIALGGIVGEYLTRPTASGTLARELAVGWQPNRDVTAWTITLRPYTVKFQSGQTLSPEDVIATYKRLTDPASGSQAISAFKGVLTPDGIVKGPRSDQVTFNLENPTASFPYLISSSTYQAIILPANYEIGTFVSKPQATGAYQFTSYTPGVGASFKRFDSWWGGRAPMDGIDVTIYSDASAADSGLLGGSVDLLSRAGFGTDHSLFVNPNLQIFRARTAEHSQVPMRVDIPPFDDYRIRQAVAYAIGRPLLMKTLYGVGGADLGNDHPFAPVYPSSVPIEQRKKDIRRAKELMAASKRPKGFSVDMVIGQNGVNVPMGQIIQRAVREIGIDVRIRTQTLAEYYGGTPGTTPWLNSPFNITFWSSRSVPNLLLTGAVKTGGIWNAAHYSNRKLDRLIQSYLGAVALKDQRKYAKQIELLLQHDTPVLWPAFTQATTAGSKKVQGFRPQPSAFNLSKTYLSQ